MSVRETLELDVSPALQSLRQFGQFLEGIATGFGDDLQQSIERAIAGLPVVKLQGDATSITDEIDTAVGAADGEKEVDGDATAVESSITEAVAAADGEKEVDGDATAVESAITEAVGAADGVKEIDADASGVTEAIEQAVADANTDLSLLPPPPGSDGGGGWGGVAAGLALAKTNAEGLTTATSAASQSLGRLGAVGGRAMGALANPVVAVGAGVGAIGALAVTSVSQMRDLERGIAEVATLLGDIPDSEVQRLTDGVRQLSGELGIAAEEIVPALYDAISAGVPADNVFDFLRTAGKASIAGVTSLGTSVNGLTNIVNAFGLQASDTEAVADSMFAAVQGGKTTFDELSRSIFQIAPAAAASGVSFQEVNAAVATLTASGTPTRVAATQLRAALVGLQRPSEELNAIFQDLGFENAELAIQQEGLGFALRAVRDASGGSAGALQQLLGSVEAVAAANVIAGTNADKFAQEMNRQGEAAGATEQAFGRMSDTLDFNLRRLREQIDDVRYGIGQTLLPVVDRLVAALVGLGDVVGPVLQNSLKGVGSALEDLADATEFATMTFDLFNTIGKQIGDWLPDVGDAADSAAGGINLFEIATRQSLGPLALVASAAQDVQELFSGDDDSVETGSEDAAGAMEKLQQQARSLYDTLQDNQLQALSEQFAPVYQAVTSFASAAAGAVPTVADAFSDLSDATNPDDLLANLDQQVALTDRWVDEMSRTQSEGYDNLTALLAEVGPEQAMLLMEQYAGREEQFEKHLEEMALAQQRANAKINETAVRGYLELRGITEEQANAIVLQLGASLQLGVPAQAAIDQLIDAPSTRQLEVIAKWRAIGSDSAGAVGENLNAETGKRTTYDFLLGMEKGLAERTLTVVDSARRAADAVVNTVNGIFGNSSPSKVMEQSGRDLVAGLVLGIGGSAPDAERAMAGLANDVLGVSVSAGSPSIRDVSVTVPITVSGGMTAEQGREIGSEAGRAAAVELQRMLRTEARLL